MLSLARPLAASKPRTSPSTLRRGTVSLFSKGPKAPPKKATKSTPSFFAKKAPGKPAGKASDGGLGSLFGGGSDKPKAKAKKAAPKPKPAVKAKPAFKAKARRAKPATRRSGQSDKLTESLGKWYGPNRKLFLPGGLLERSEVNPVLDGKSPGDYGLDPFNLSKTAEDLQKWRLFEILHARWAMLAVLGIALPEAISANGANLQFTEGPVTWWQVGAGAIDPLAFGAGAAFFIPLAVFVPIQVALLGAAEKFRTDGTGPSGWSPGNGAFESSVFDGADPCHPGGPFDPLGFANDPEAFAELKVKEIKNGRLAMIAFLGCVVQAAVTKEGAYAAWSRHVTNPFGENITTLAQQVTEVVREPTL